MPSNSELMVMSSSTETVGSDNECTESPFWRWYQSQTPFCSFAIVRCETRKEMGAVKEMLNRKKVEEKKANELKMEDNELKIEDETVQSASDLGWTVAECCCDKDVPHRVADKLMLLSHGPKNVRLVKRPYASKVPLIQQKSLPLNLEFKGVRTVSRQPPVSSMVSAPIVDPIQIALTTLSADWSYQSPLPDTPTQ